MITVSDFYIEPHSSTRLVGPGFHDLISYMDSLATCHLHLHGKNDIVTFESVGVASLFATLVGCFNDMVLWQKTGFLYVNHESVAYLKMRDGLVELSLSEIKNSPLFSSASLKEVSGQFNIAMVSISTSLKAFEHILQDFVWSNPGSVLYSVVTFPNGSKKG